jgi:hypothetical protein
MKIAIDRRFKKNVAGRFGKYTFEVGVLEDGPHKLPRPRVDGQAQLGSYAGGPVRRASRTESGQSMSDVSKSLRDNLGLNYLTEPFKKATSDIIRFTREFFKYAFGRSQKKRLENLLQAVVRNPMLRGDYGSNSAITRKIKGFDRKTIDTAQLFKSIKAAVRVKGGRGV